MGKAGQARKKRKQAELTRTESNLELEDSDPSEPTSKDFLLGLISPQELATATRVLQTLSKHPNELIKDQKQHLKQIKTAVWDFQRQAAAVSGTGQSSSLAV